MKALIQRVSESSVSVEGETIAAIGRGMLVLLGVLKGDGRADAEWMAKKCCELRIFEDESGKMNRSVIDIRGEILVVSQFTLAANCSRGRRPSFEDAAPPGEAKALYELFCERCRGHGVAVQQGRFAAHMAVVLVNDGPVTLMVERS